MPIALKVYRRSELEAISEGCLKRYHDIWIDGADDTSDVALVGIGFAAVKHQYLLLLVDHQVPQDAELANVAFIEGVRQVQTPTRLIPELRSVWMFHAEKFELALDRYVTSEERGTSGAVGWSPDLVLAHGNTLEIVDDKSGWRPPLTEEEVRQSFQARVYARYARDRWKNFSEYKFTLHAVRFNKSTSVVFSQAELDTVDVEIAAAIATIEEAQRTNHWPAVAGPSCHFCELACPIADQEITLPKRLTVEQYQNLGAWLLVADKQLKAAKKLMKASVNVYGPCDLHGIVWDNRPVTSRSYPAAVVIDALKPIQQVGGLDTDSLTISHSALKGLFKQFPLLESQLLPHVKERVGWRFAAKKPGEIDTGDDE